MADPTKPPTPTLAALGDIDALIAAMAANVARQGILSGKKFKASQRAAQVERRQNSREFRLLQRQYRDSKIAPAPLVASASSAEVQAARRQTAIDASGRMGMRKSILAGESGGFRGSSGGMARSPILG